MVQYTAGPQLSDIPEILRPQPPIHCMEGYQKAGKVSIEDSAVNITVTAHVP